MIINLIAGLLGIVLYTAMKAREFICGKKRKEFNVEIFIEDNFLGWCWSVLILLLVWGILHLIPESNVLVGQILGGIDLISTPLGFLGLGNFLGFTGREKTK